MEDRVTYGKIRAWFLGSYYSYCKVKLSHQSSWTEGESEVGYAYGEFENAFELPIEKLMLEVIALILSAGRSPGKVKKYHLDAISKLLEEIELSSILEDLPSDEMAELKDDLRLLGIC
ncbi:Imm2 family immunity protein [Pseudomonas alliivorans]|nr:Imm2 family immunity protein [Pseudomonas alliivorans]MEE4876131.1 Imm2 family immunity protein [Pseudomonas alliivorans]